jgi:anti-anti-sigma factor
VAPQIDLKEAGGNTMKLILLPLHNDEDVLRVRCDGPLSCREKDDPLQVLLGPRCYHNKVLLSLESCQAIDTSGLSWLMQSHKGFQKAGGKLVFWAVQPVVADVLRFARLAPLLNIAATERAACEMIQEEPPQPSAPAPSTEGRQAGPGPAIRFPR